MEKQNAPSQTIQHASSEVVMSKIRQNGSKVLVQFVAPWCGACHMIESQVQELANTYRGLLEFLRVDFDQDQDFAKQYGVFEPPTFLFLQNGELVDLVIGVLPREELASRVELLVRSGYVGRA